MKDNENLKMRVNQLDEQLSNTLRAIDTFHADMDTFREYTIENNKVVNSILHKLDEHAEKFDRVHGQLEKMNIQFIQVNQEIKELQESNKAMNSNIQANNSITLKVVEELAKERELREAQFSFLVKRLEQK